MKRTIYTIAAVVDEATGEIEIGEPVQAESDDHLMAASSLSSDQLFVIEEHTLH